MLGVMVDRIRDNKAPYEYWGVYRGIVIDNSGVKGRCKVYVPGVYPEEFSTDASALPWAEPAQPVFGGAYATASGSQNQQAGFTAWPLLSAHVWIFFEGGDWNTPVYFAAIYGGEGWTAEHNNQHVIQTSNVKIVVDEEPDDSASTSQHTVSGKFEQSPFNQPSTRKPTRVQVKITGNVRLEIIGDVDAKIVGDTTLEQIGDRYEHIDGNYIRRVTGSVIEEIDGDYRQTVAGDRSMSASNGSHQYNGDLSVTAGDDVAIAARDDLNLSAKDIDIRGSNSVDFNDGVWSLDSSKNATMRPKRINVRCSQQFKVRAPDVDVRET